MTDVSGFGNRRTGEEEIEVVLLAETRGAAPAPASEAQAPFRSPEEALQFAPDLRYSIENRTATFDDLFYARYGYRPVESDATDGPAHPLELAARRFLYPYVRGLFQAAHGPIQEEYWCEEVEGAAVLTDAGLHQRPQFRAIVDWQQEDGPFVEQIIALDELEVATRYVANPDDNRTCQNLIFDAYSSALDALDNRRVHQLTDQTAELALVKRQVALAQKFYKAVAQRHGQDEALRGIALGFWALLWLIAVVGTFMKITGIETVGVPLGPLLGWAFVGAVGAFISVLARVGREEFTPNWEATQGELWMTGAFRPIVGAVLGAAVPVFFLGGITAAGAAPTDGATSRFFYTALAFAAGFSERWAQDLIAKQPSALGSPRSAESKESPSSPSNSQGA